MKLYQLIFASCNPGFSLNNDKLSAEYQPGEKIFNISKELLEITKFKYKADRIESLGKSKFSSFFSSEDACLESISYLCISKRNNYVDNIYAIFMIAKKRTPDTKREEKVVHILVGLPEKYEMWKLLSHNCSCWAASAIKDEDYYLLDKRDINQFLPVLDTDKQDFENTYSTGFDYFNDKKELFKKAISFIFEQFPKHEKNEAARTLLIKDTPENIKVWIAKISSLLPLPLLRNFTFSTNLTGLNDERQRKYLLTTQEKIDNANSFYEDNKRMNFMLAGFHPADQSCQTIRESGSDYIVLDSKSGRFGYESKFFKNRFFDDIFDDPKSIKNFIENIWSKQKDLLSPDDAVKLYESYANLNNLENSSYDTIYHTYCDQNIVDTSKELLVQKIDSVYKRDEILQEDIKNKYKLLKKLKEFVPALEIVAILNEKLENYVKQANFEDIEHFIESIDNMEYKAELLKKFISLMNPSLVQSISYSVLLSHFEEYKQYTKNNKYNHSDLPIEIQKKYINYILQKVKNEEFISVAEKIINVSNELSRYIYDIEKERLDMNLETPPKKLPNHNAILTFIKQSSKLRKYFFEKKKFEEEFFKENFVDYIDVFVEYTKDLSKDKYKKAKLCENAKHTFLVLLNLAVEPKNFFNILNSIKEYVEIDKDMVKDYNIDKILENENSYSEFLCFFPDKEEELCDKVVDKSSPSMLIHYMLYVVAKKEKSKFLLKSIDKKYDEIFAQKKANEDKNYAKQGVKFWEKVVAYSLLDNTQDEKKEGSIIIDYRAYLQVNEAQDNLIKSITKAPVDLAEDKSKRKTVAEAKKRLVNVIQNNKKRNIKKYSAGHIILKIAHNICRKPVFSIYHILFMIVLIGTLNYFQEGKNEVLPAEHEYESEQNNQNIEKGSIIEEEKNISSEENKSQEQAVELDITENSETEELSPKNTQNDINVPEYKIRQPKTVGINSVKTNAHKKQNISKG